MGSDRSDHRDRVELFVRNQAEVIGRRARRRITPRHRRETRLIDVANPSQLGAVILGKVAQQIRTPITASDYAYADRTHGTERIASIRGKGNRSTRLNWSATVSVARFKREASEDACAPLQTFMNSCPRGRRRVSHDRGLGRHIFGYDRAGAHHCAFANRHAAENRGPAADAGAPLYNGRNHRPITRDLPGSVRVGSAGNLIVNKSDAVPDEDLVFDRHTFADEAMTGDFAVAADTGTLLDLDEGSHAGAVADFAPIEVYEIMNDYIASEFYIKPNHTELSWHPLGENPHAERMILNLSAPRLYRRQPLHPNCSTRCNTRSSRCSSHSSLRPSRCSAPRRKCGRRRLEVSAWRAGRPRASCDRHGPPGSHRQQKSTGSKRP